MRIVSLLPATTEILFALGAGDDVVRVTFECDYPPPARERTIVSSTALATGLAPAEIDAAVRAAIANGEDLYRLGCTARVLTVDPHRFEQVLASILTIGDVVGRSAAATTLVDSLRARLEKVALATAMSPAARVAVIEWTDPPFSAGHWVPDLVTAAGAIPVGGNAGGRSAQTTWQAIAAMIAPDQLPARRDIAALIS